MFKDLSLFGPRFQERQKTNQKIDIRAIVKIMRSYKIQSSRNVFFTGDEHYFHGLMLRFRPFLTIKEMNEFLIEQHNYLVESNDIVIHHGDFSFGTADQTAKLLMGLKGYHIIIPCECANVCQELK